MYERFKTGKAICWAINVAKMLGMRHLLVRMDTNFICNLRCKTCFFSAPDAKKMFIKPMSLDLFKTIAKDVFPKTRILFLSCGAEPLMTKNFVEFIRVAAKYSVPYTGYATNGLLLTEEIVKTSIECQVDEITISIDGATKGTYEYIRTRGNFDTLLNNLAMYRDIVKKVRGKTPSLRFNFTVTKTNHLEMPVLVELAKEYGVSMIKFRVYTDWGGEFSEGDESILGHEKTFNSSIREARTLAEKYNIDIVAPKEFSLDGKKNEGRGSDESNDSMSKPPCIHPWFYRYINPEGKIRVCACLSVSTVGLSKNFTLSDFENSKEEKERKYLLTNKQSESCFEKVCQGFYLKRANDDVNFLEDTSD